MPNRVSTRTRLPDHAKVKKAKTAVTIASNARAAVAIAVISPDRSTDMPGSVLLRGGGHTEARPASDRGFRMD